MPEETTPPEGNSVAAGGAQIDWDSPDNPYVQRAKEQQAGFTQSQQALRQLETDRDAYIALGQKHGFEFEFEDAGAQEQQGVDPALAQAQQELAEMRQWRDTVEAERQQKAYDDGRLAVHAQNDAWAKEAGITLADFDHAAIIQRALESGAETESDVKPIFDAYVAHKTAEREAILAEAAEARRRPRVPHTPGGGAADTGIPDYSEMSRADIDKAMAERAMGAL